MAATIGTSEYATRTRDLIRLVNEIRATGIEAEVGLPRIAVVGNQSAGKSSLIEAIAGIRVPRSAGTCTRCPMECRLERTDRAWHSEVLLRIGDQPEVSFGDPIVDPDLLEDRIRRAQSAILSPGVDRNTFLGDDVPPTPVLSFSSNVVCINVAGPDVPDLAFVDLPGIISNVGPDGDPNDMDLIKDLATSYMEAPNTLIIVTIPMTDDLQNQTAATLARRADPAGRRTIGVLTKPDAIQPGDHDRWLAILEGRSEPLHHGYWLTKQPTSADLARGVSFEEARQIADRFFQSEEPWRSCTFEIKRRMGIPNLVSKLSRELSRLIDETLPDIMDEIWTRLHRTVADLEELPAPIQNPSAELQLMVYKFVVHFAALVEGAKSTPLLRTFRLSCLQMKRNLNDTAPNCRPFVSAQEDNAFVGAFNPAVLGEDPHHREGRPIYLPEVSDVIETSITRELPLNIPYSAKVTFFQEQFSRWSLFVFECFDRVEKTAHGEIIRLIENDFGDYPNLKAAFRKACEGHLRVQAKKTKLHLEWFLDLEPVPFTINDQYFCHYREKYLEHYRHAREALPPVMAPPDALVPTYEAELEMMAAARAYFQVSYKRMIDNVARCIDKDFLHGLKDGMMEALIQGLGLSGNEPGRAERYLSEDSSVGRRRRSLIQDKERLETFRDTWEEFHSHIRLD
ncbi:hypothetical protein SISNIDRAFT_410420 [Sistotremastrum niveocremeum HHB9708]|uniref:P-loop containing nucleoside triphosphate hydrolase protein n=1 Tax=Sistotremastrum niveocremeum HHB9708 TaxID=1314777 RepID=A0A164VHQ0_9AGAM|nr:hypothetical protein SISNIDRAFT_410420 [Sistotremastrum niveocremeum HHB9708]